MWFQNRNPDLVVLLLKDRTMAVHRRGVWAGEARPSEKQGRCSVARGYVFARRLLNCSPKRFTPWVPRSMCAGHKIPLCGGFLPICRVSSGFCRSASSAAPRKDLRSFGAVPRSPLFGHLFSSGDSLSRKFLYLGRVTGVSRDAGLEPTSWGCCGELARSVSVLADTRVTARLQMRFGSGQRDRRWGLGKRRGICETQISFSARVWRSVRQRAKSGAQKVRGAGIHPWALLPRGVVPTSSN